MYLNVCASFSWDKEQNYIKCERKKKRRQVAWSKRGLQISQISTLLFPMPLRDDHGDGNENGKRATELDQQNNNFARAFHVFCTLLCRHFTTTMWKCLILHFLENLNTRQRLRFSFSDLRYSLLEFSSGKICQHLTN